MHPLTILTVAGGGAMGAYCRYAIGRWAGRVLGSRFFYGTLIVNVLGCFCIGLALGAASQGGAAAMTWRALITDGFCGALTTFSTFSLESATALREGAVGKAMFYMGASMVLCLSSAALGLHLTG